MVALKPVAAVAALALVQSAYASCGSYTGCFESSSYSSTLSYTTSLDGNSMTVDKCVSECTGKGYRYAGLGYV